eukprot:8982749-Alexandrium_andersonii.AAC.1
MPSWRAKGCTPGSCVRKSVRTCGTQVDGRVQPRGRRSLEGSKARNTWVATALAWGGLSGVSNHVAELHT